MIQVKSVKEDLIAFFWFTYARFGLGNSYLVIRLKEELKYYGTERPSRVQSPMAT